MYEEFCAEQRKRADAHLAAFLEANPEFAADHEQPQWMKGTHLVSFGSHRGRPAVFKYYDGDPRRGHEQRALELFEPTGLVAQILGQTDLMLVMTRLPGLPLHELEKDLDQAQREEVYLRLGEAVAKVVETAPGGRLKPKGDTAFRACNPQDFYNTPYDALTVLYRAADTPVFFDTTLARAGRVLRDRDVPSQEALTRSLAALERNRDAIVACPTFVHMNDFHANNIMADGTRITGFIDLEMTRYGNEVLLLGAALSSMCRQPQRWRAFRAGYEDVRGIALSEDMLSLIRAAASFSTWIRFTWYWSTDDQPWWAREMDLRSSAVRAIKEGVEAVEGIPI